MRKSANQTFEKTTAWNTKELAVNSKLEGVYTTKEEFTGDFGDTIKYVVEAPDGTKYGVYGTASLNRQFSRIPEGSYVWIEYTGEVVSKLGRTVKNFVVDYDDEYQK